MIKKIISEKFEKRIYTRYIKEISFMPAVDTLYATVLSNLSNHETEKAITYMIMIAENDIKFEPLQHLARLMLFSLSEDFIKKKGHSLKERHPNIFKYLTSLEDKTLSIEKEIIILQNNILKIEDKMNEGFSLNSFLKKKDYNNQIHNMREEIFKKNDELVKIKKEIVNVTEISTIEEYTKIIALILDVISNPQRFNPKFQLKS